MFREYYTAVVGELACAPAPFRAGRRVRDPGLWSMARKPAGKLFYPDDMFAAVRVPSLRGLKLTLPESFPDDYPGYGGLTWPACR
jgi:hypothetical protein